jgi:hypothetical protein
LVTGVASSLRLDFIGAQRRHYNPPSFSSSPAAPKRPREGWSSAFVGYENEDDDEDEANWRQSALLPRPV